MAAAGTVYKLIRPQKKTRTTPMFFVCWLIGWSYIVTITHAIKSRAISTEAPLKKTTLNDLPIVMIGLTINQVKANALISFETNKIQIDQSLMSEVDPVFDHKQNKYLVIFEWHEMKTIQYVTFGEQTILGLGPQSDIWYYFRTIEVCLQQQSIFLFEQEGYSRCQDLELATKIPYSYFNESNTERCEYYFETPEGMTITFNRIDLLSSSVVMNKESAWVKHLVIGFDIILKSTAIVHGLDQSLNVFGLSATTPPIAISLTDTHAFVGPSLDTSLKGPYNFILWFVVLIIFYKWWLGRPWSKTDQFGTYSLENFGSLVLFPSITILVTHSPHYQTRADMFFYPVKEAISFSTVIRIMEIVTVYVLPALRLVLYIYAHYWKSHKDAYISRRAVYFLQIGTPCVFSFMTAVTDTMQVFMCWLVWNALVALLIYSLAAIVVQRILIQLNPIGYLINLVAFGVLGLQLVLLIIMGIYGICYEFMARIVHQTFISETRILLNLIVLCGIGFVAACYFASNQTLILHQIDKRNKIN